MQDYTSNLETSVRRFVANLSESSFEGQLTTAPAPFEIDGNFDTAGNGVAAVNPYGAVTPAYSLVGAYDGAQYEAASRNLQESLRWDEAAQAAADTPNWTQEATTVSEGYAAAYGESAPSWSDVSNERSFEVSTALNEESLQGVDVYDLPLEPEVPYTPEPSAWVETGGYAPSYSDLSTSDLKSLREMVDVSEQARASAVATKQYLAKKAEEPVVRKKKQMVFDEKQPLKAAPTALEALALAAFSIYLLLVCTGIVRVDSIPFIGPAIASHKVEAKTAADMRKENQAQATAQINKARELSKKGDKEGSFEAIDQSLKLAPTSEAYAERARMAAALGYSDAAVSDYNRAVELKRDPALILERGLLHLTSRNMKAAAADFTRVIKTGGVKDVFRVYAFRARANAESGRLLDAIKDYKKAIALAPSPDYPELSGYKNELAKCTARASRNVRRTLVAHRSR